MVFSGHLPAGGGVGGDIGGADIPDAAGAAAPEAAKEKDSFDLKLKVADAKAKIKIIKEVRVITGLGLKEVLILLNCSLMITFCIRLKNLLRRHPF